jgi:hypothetical protein
VLRKIYNFCLENWKALGIVLGGLATFLIGSKRQKDKNEDDVMLLDQQIKETAFIENVHENERSNLIKAELKYKIAMEALEKKYDDENSKLKREKDHIYKQTLSQAKNDPDKLDRILTNMGITETKK